MRIWIGALVLGLGCAETPGGPDPCKLLDASTPGPLEAERRAAQGDPVAQAALFHREASSTGDSGFRLLAEAAAACALRRDPDDAEALAQHAAALYHTHRFAEAELEARSLTGRRGTVGDWLLLGDARAEQGHLDGAADAYQQAADLSPEAAVFDRIMNLRYMMGDATGALEMAERAVSSATDPEQRAWSLAWLGWYKALDGQPAPELDARGCAIALAETDPERARTLLEAEWKGRQDALTRAARAWVSHRLGQDSAAEARAAATGSVDPQVLYLAGRTLEDPALLREALATGPGLLPSQRAVAEGLLAEPPG